MFVVGCPLGPARISAASRVARARVVSATIGRRGLACAPAVSCATGEASDALPRAPEVFARAIRLEVSIAPGIAENRLDASRSMRVGRTRVRSGERREGGASCPVVRESLLTSSLPAARAEAMGGLAAYGSGWEVCDAGPMGIAGPMELAGVAGRV